MATPTWPTTLPQSFLLADLTDSLGDGRAMARGRAGRPPRPRRQTGLPVRPLSGSIVVTTAQRAILDDFVADDLAGGTEWFFLPDQVFGNSQLSESLLGPILVDEEENILVVGGYSLVMFDGLPTYAALSDDYWRCSFTLTVLE